jgi:hypothetical protein
MYLVNLKSLLTDAMRRTFDADYINEQFRDLHVSIEYPDDRQHYPGLWVDYEPAGELEIMGVGHAEYDGTATGRKYTRWRFQGHATYTIAALTSLERDLLYDEVVRVMAFGREAESTSEFRAYIENNDLIACNFDFDQIDTRGSSVTPGTPWNSDEMIYEITVAMEVVGEFVSDSLSATLLPLTQVSLDSVFTLHEGDPHPEWV